MRKTCLGWDAQFCGSVEKIIEFSDNTTNKEIEDSFEENIGVPYDKENCYYYEMI